MKDPNILLSIVNCKLRDTNKSLFIICDDLDLSEKELTELLASIGYSYNQNLNQFVCNKKDGLC